MSKLEIILVGPILELERDVLLLEGKLQEAQQTQAFNSCYLSFYRTSWQHLNTTLFHIGTPESREVRLVRQMQCPGVILHLIFLKIVIFSTIFGQKYNFPRPEYLFKISHHKEFCNISELSQFQKMLKSVKISPQNMPKPFPWLNEARAKLNQHC